VTARKHIFLSAGEGRGGSERCQLSRHQRRKKKGKGKGDFRRRGEKTETDIVNEGRSKEKRRVARDSMGAAKRGKFPNSRKRVPKKGTSGASILGGENQCNIGPSVEWGIKPSKKERGRMEFWCRKWGGSEAFLNTL